MPKISVAQSLLRGASALMLITLTTACGFSAIYADRGAGLQSALAGIDIAAIESETDAGYLLQTELQSRFQTSSASTYALDVELDESTASAAITTQANTVQFSFQLEASYILRDSNGGVLLASEKRAFGSYGAVASQYATLVAREEAIRVAAIRLADEIEMDLVLHFKNLN